MRNERVLRFARISLICALAIAANLVLFRTFLWWMPLFVDTVFTVAVAFALGLLPGFAVAILTWAADGVLGVGAQPFHPFVVVAAVEVGLVCALRPAEPPARDGRFSRVPFFREHDPDIRDEKIVALLDVGWRLLILYFACVLAASVIGGVIDLFYHTMWGASRPYHIGINAFRLALLQEGVPALYANILSRVQINLIDRLFVVFGGYFVYRGIAGVVEKAGRLGKHRLSGG